MLTAMVPAARTLTARINFSNPKTSRVPVVSNIEIMIGDVIVASKSLGGKYNETQALKEFQRSWKLWKKHEMGWEMAKAMKLLP